MGGVKQDALLGSVMSWSCRVAVLLKDSNLFFFFCHFVVVVV